MPNAVQAPPSNKDDGDNVHIKPSERFARPNGVVYLNDTPQLRYSYTNHPAFTYNIKHTSSYSSQDTANTNATSPTLSSADGRGTPPTSVEDVYSGMKNRRPASVYDAFSPPLPPKSNHNGYGRPSSDRTMDSGGLQIDTLSKLIQEEHEEESRDQLSNLRSDSLSLSSSPRRVDYHPHNSALSQAPTQNNINLNDQNDNSANDTATSDSREVKKSPRRKSFFSFGSKSSSSKNADSSNVKNVDMATVVEGEKNVSAMGTGTGSANKGRRHSFDSGITALSPSLSTSPPPSTMNGMMERKSEDGSDKERRSSRSSARNLFNRRSNSSTRSSSSISPPPLAAADINDQAPVHAVANGKKGSKFHHRQNPYDTSTRNGGNNMKAALNDGWVVLPRNEASDTYAAQSFPAHVRPVETSSPLPTPPSQHTSRNLPSTHGDAQELNNLSSAGAPQTPSPIKSRHKVLSNWKGASSPLSLGMLSPPNTVSPPSASTSSYINGKKNIEAATSSSRSGEVRSPPFFMRGRHGKDNNARRDSSKSTSPLTSSSSPTLSFNNNRQQVPLMTPPVSPPSASDAANQAPVVHHWPAESHVFGAAQAVIGNATIGPHIPQFRKSTPQANSIRSSIVSPNKVKQDARQEEAADKEREKEKAQVQVQVPRSDSPSSSNGLGKGDDVFGPPHKATPAPQDSRQRVYDLLAVPQSRKSSLYTTSSGTSTPSQVTLRRCTGKPRFEEALLQYPKTILANILDHLSYRSFKRLSHASAQLYRATLPPNDASDFAEVIKQRYLASYGYRTLPSYIKPSIPFTLRVLQSFNAGNEFSLSEFSIFAREHKRQPLKLATTRMFRDSTRAFNRLLFRLQFQSQFAGSSSYSDSSSSSPASTSPRESRAVDLTLPLIKPYWKYYTKPDQVQVFKHGRCAMLRVWVPCDNNWMSDAEVMEVEREVHRSGVWKALRRGDLVRNIALGDIANEGLLIFDGKYLRDLSYAHDTIGHLPSWINSFTFSPSYFHNQIASSTQEPIVYLDITSFAKPVQQNLLLCKEKVDLASPSGEQYKITRYVYRTVVELVPGAVLRSGEGKDTDETLHPDWAGQLIIETDGTTEAAKALLSRTKAISRDVAPDQPRPPPHINNRPYKILRNMSRPGLIFCRVVEDAQPAQLFR